MCSRPPATAPHEAPHSAGLWYLFLSNICSHTNVSPPIREGKNVGGMRWWGVGGNVGGRDLRKRKNVGDVGDHDQHRALVGALVMINL